MIVFLRRKRNTNPQAASNLDSHWKLEYSLDGKMWAPIHYDKVTCGLGVKNFREMMNKILQGGTAVVLVEVMGLRVHDVLGVSV